MPLILQNADNCKYEFRYAEEVRSLRATEPETGDVVLYHVVTAGGTRVGMYAKRRDEVQGVLITDEGKLLRCYWGKTFPNGTAQSIG